MPLTSLSLECMFNLQHHTCNLNQHSCFVVEKSANCFFTVFLVKLMVIHEYGLSDMAFTHASATYLNNVSQEIYSELLYLAILMGTW